MPPFSPLCDGDNNSPPSWALGGLQEKTSSAGQHGVDWPGERVPGLVTAEWMAGPTDESPE